MPYSVSRLLVKARPQAEGSAMTLDGMQILLEPLFPDSHSSASSSENFGISAQAIWHMATLPAPISPAEAWDQCHRLTTGGFGMAAIGGVEFAEPDFIQTWTHISASDADGLGLAAAGPRDCSQPAAPRLDPYTAPGVGDVPYDWRWHLGAAYSGLDGARAQVNEGTIEAPDARVTIAHLDTGYRDQHVVLPEFLDRGLAHSFVKGDADPGSALDPGIAGGINNPGHGTGTLSLLAGKTFDGTPFQAVQGVVGGAPFAHVIPVRVANSVVEFANSSIAQGIQYAIDQGADVVSISMGGVPSQAWVEVVNRAYEAGVTLVTAAGNNFGIGVLRAPRFIVWPARFQRVIAACGVMSSGHPWADFINPKIMGGSYGPDSKMDTAMASFTPNVPWASYDCPAIVDFNGNGTSAATPQIAAAAACVFQKHSAALQTFTGADRWKRVETIRQVLFQTANDTERKHFGRGLLRADLAVAAALPDPATLTKLQEDRVLVPFLGPVIGALFGLARNPVSTAMLHMEAAQILASSSALEQIFSEADVDPDGDIPDAVAQRVISALLASEAPSSALRRALGGSDVSHPPAGGGSGGQVAPSSAASGAAVDSRGSNVVSPGERVHPQSRRRVPCASLRSIPRWVCASIPSH